MKNLIKYLPVFIVLCTHIIPFATPVTGALTFTFAGNQTVASITLSARTYTGQYNKQIT